MSIIIRGIILGLSITAPVEPSNVEIIRLTGILLTISNPAVLLLWTGIMGANLAANQASLEQGILLSIGILIGVLIFFSLLILLIHYGKNFLQQRYLKYVSLGAGIVLLFFCFRFVYDLVERFF